VTPIDRLESAILGLEGMTLDNLDREQILTIDNVLNDLRNVLNDLRERPEAA
jgi:hypothetical protein